MTPSRFVFLVLISTLCFSCSLPQPLPALSPELGDGGQSDLAATAAVSVVAPAEATDTPVPPPLNLDHHPLYWFAPLNLEHPTRGSLDYMDLFIPDADWAVAASHIQVFKLYGGWAETGPFHELEQAIADIRARGLGLAIEHGPLFADDTCGVAIEGFAAPGFLLTVQRVKDAGGTLDFIALDEPYYWAHFYDGEQACNWTTEKIAADVGEMILKAQEIFPDLIVGDIEPVTGPADAAAYKHWLETFRAVNGFDLAFLHLDMDWANPAWPEEAMQMEAYGRELGIPIGIIYIGNPFDVDNLTWLATAGERVKRYELEAGGQPDHIIFQSWNDKPDHVLPESDPTAYTSFLKAYFEDKSALGFSPEMRAHNLALNKNLRYSRAIGGNEGQYALDGDTGTTWSSGDDAPQWIEIDLGQPYDIGALRLLPSQYPAGNTIHRVLGKGPGADQLFIEITRFDGFTEDGQWLVFEPDLPIEGIRYIRIETVASPSWVAWREIEIIAANAP
jgi:hypothetical protein